MLALLEVGIDCAKFKHRKIILGYQLDIRDNCRRYQSTNIAPIYDPVELKLSIVRQSLSMPILPAIYCFYLNACPTVSLVAYIMTTITRQTLIRYVWKTWFTFDNTNIRSCMFYFNLLEKTITQERLYKSCMSRVRNNDTEAFNDKHITISYSESFDILLIVTCIFLF